MCNVLDALGGADDDGEQSAERMFQSMIVHIKHLHDKVHAFELSDFENVYRNNLLDKVSSLVGRNLQSIDPQTKENLGKALFGLRFFFHGAKEFVLVVSEDFLRYQ